MNRRIFVGWCAATILTFALLASSRASAAQSDVYFNVTLRSAGQARIHAAVYASSSARAGVTILAVPGFTETAAIYQPLATAIFADHILGKVVQRIVAIEMPGHGLSSAPSGLPNGALFGDLAIEDNVSVVLQAIDELRSLHLGASVIMGHSMGGLEVLASQETLLSHGSTLAAHGIFGAVLLAPVPPANSQYTRGPLPDLSSFITSDPSLGTYLFLPPPVAQIDGAYTTTAGTLVPNAPTPDQIAPYNDKEPITTVLQLVASTPPRPTVRAQAFALTKGTVLSILSFSEDVLVPAADMAPLFSLMTGKVTPLYRPIVAPDAVHSMFVSNPNGLLDALIDVL
ncbi:MAG TPA: alpha/beta fold hydrolase [Polyangiaceae bacterium]|nr:alpha/beta fold hydrolase [Polyangiaceae bacterium]